MVGSRARNEPRREFSTQKREGGRHGRSMRQFPIGKYRSYVRSHEYEWNVQAFEHSLRPFGGAPKSFGVVDRNIKAVHHQSGKAGVRVADRAAACVTMDGESGIYSSRETGK